MAKKQLDGRKDRYFQIHHYMMKTDAWSALSVAARAIYLQIGFRYDGSNNGKITFSVRDAAAECNLNKDTAGRAFKELVDRGFIEETRHGGISKKTRLASEWRLTAFKCDLTGALKTCTFMHRGGSEFSSHTPQKRGRETGKTYPSTVRNKYRECPKKGDTLSELNPDESPECPKQGDTQVDFEHSTVRNKGTHIIYQSPGTDSTALGSPAQPAATDAPAPAGSSPIAAAALPPNPALPSNAQHAGSERLTVDAMTPPRGHRK
jgi:hypothetical protein